MLGTFDGAVQALHSLRLRWQVAERRRVQATSSDASRAGLLNAVMHGDSGTLEPLRFSETGMYCNFDVIVA